MHVEGSKLMSFLIVGREECRIRRVKSGAEKKPPIAGKYRIEYGLHRNLTEWRITRIMAKQAIRNYHHTLGGGLRGKTAAVGTKKKQACPLPNLT